MQCNLMEHKFPLKNRSFRNHKRWLGSGVFASGSSDWTVRLSRYHLDYPDRRYWFRVVHGHTSDALSLAITEDGKLLSGGSDGVIMGYI